VITAPPAEPVAVAPPAPPDKNVLVDAAMALAALAPVCPSTLLNIPEAPK
jgi:hypothetical protein